MERDSWILKSHPMIEIGLILSVLMYVFYGIGLHLGSLPGQAAFVGVGLAAILAAILGATRYAQWDTVIATLCRFVVILAVLLVVTPVVANGTPSLQFDPIPLLKAGTLLEKALTATLAGTLLTGVMISVGAILQSLSHLRTDPDSLIDDSL